MHSPEKERNTVRPPKIFAAVLMSVGAVLAVGGAYLLSLGGSPYYVGAGLALAVSAGFIWAGRREGAWVYAALLVLTTCWATWEAGPDGWALAPRLVALAIIGLWFLTPIFRNSLRPIVRTHRFEKFAKFPMFALAFVCATVLGLAFHQLRVQPVDPAYQVMPSQPFTNDFTDASSYPAPAEEWISYGGDPGGRRYSALTQLTPKNVGQLELAWTFHVGLPPKGQYSSLEVNPLKVGDTVYLCTGMNDIIALDAETGSMRWRHDAHVDMRGVFGATCRGIAYFVADASASDCRERIISSTVDSRLIAVDAHSGASCQSFGQGGQTSLLEGLGKVTRGYYHVTSAPAVARGKVVVGGWITDGQYWGEPSGVIRAFDATTGSFAWAFDIGKPDDHSMPPAGKSFTASTPNSWAPISVDEKLGLVYLPMGNATPDYYGAQRRAIDDEISSSVLALDAETGAMRWNFQTAHHDLWDYDVPTQPVLVDLPAPGGVRHALIQATKRGEVFVLDRVTGKPLATVEERAVPSKGIAAGERVAPTQPFSVGMPSFRGPELTESMMWGLTPLDQMLCRIWFKTARYEGPMTPPGQQANIAYPGSLGGTDWGGVSIDPQRHLMIVNSDRFANRDRLMSRAEATERGLFPADENHAFAEGTAAQENTPFAAEVKPFMSPIGIPCQQPPYGLLTAVDLVTHQVIWSNPLGTARDSGPFGLHLMLPIPLGTPTLGGSITTASGLTFIAATQERVLRAMETTTGKILWSTRLPAGGISTPTTYSSRESGRQFVVIAAGGNILMGAGSSDSVVAYALPKR